MAGDLVPYGRNRRKRCEVVAVVPPTSVPIEDEGPSALRAGYLLGLGLGLEQRQQAGRFHELHYREQVPVRGRRSGVFPHPFLILMLFALPVLSALAALSPISPVVHLLAMTIPLVLTLVVAAVIASRSPI